MTQLTLADRIAMYIGGGFVILGTVLIGLLEMALGTGHPVTGDGQIVHEALIPIEIRSYIILAGLLVWGLYAVYRVATPPAMTAGTETGTRAGGAD